MSARMLQAINLCNAMAVEGWWGREQLQYSLLPYYSVVCCMAKKKEILVSHVRVKEKQIIGRARKWC